MTQQITVNCPNCNKPVMTLRILGPIQHLCQSCGGWFTFTYQDGQAVAKIAATPEEASLSAAGGWRENRAK